MLRYCLSSLGNIDSALRAAHRILIATDFDGTLCALANSPGEAIAPRATLEVLRRMAGCARVTLAVISGRTLADLLHRLPPGHVYAGNHGLEISGCGLEFVHPSAPGLRPELQSACRALSAIARSWPGAWVEDKGLSATLHYRHVDPLKHRSLRFAARRALAPLGGNFSLRSGQLALEVCPKLGWDKASALDLIRTQLGPFDACICIGDDGPDEALFRANQGQVNIKVGPGRPTLANFHMVDPIETAILLEHVLDICDTRSSSASGEILAATAEASSAESAT